MRPGGELVGRYLLEKRLGRGGMGEVWCGFDSRLDRRVAIKLLSDPHPSSRPSAAQVERFRREALITAGLQHPGITVVHDADQDGDQWFIVMELLKGQDLAALLAGAREGLPIDQVVSLGVQIARALAVAHDGGVVHRDLKPANLFLTDGGQVKICDFGIAFAADATSALTVVGQVFGTPLYMSPEQCRGERVDARSDLYSFGCVLHALLTGRPPFTGSPDLVMHQHKEISPSGPRAFRAEVPGKLDEFVRLLLAKDPGSRLPGAEMVGDALEAIKINTVADPQPKVGERFLGTVVKTTPFGAFVSLPHGKDGLLHISELGNGKRVRNVEDVVKVGDNLYVEITEIDKRGKVSLSRTQGAALRPAPGRPQPWRGVHAALVNLGWSGKDADTAVDAVAADLTGDEIPPTAALLKSAIRKLSRRS